MLKSSMWDLAKLRLPASSQTELRLLQEIADYSSLVEQTNEAIRSRENYRISNEAMSNFYRRLRLYDEHLLSVQGQLVSLLQTLDAAVSSRMRQR